MQIMEFSHMEKREMVSHLTDIHHIKVDRIIGKATKGQLTQLHEHIERFERVLDMLPGSLVAMDYETRKQLCNDAGVPVHFFQNTDTKRGYRGSGVLNDLIESHNTKRRTSHIHKASTDMPLPDLSTYETPTGVELTDEVISEMSLADSNRIIKLLNADIEDMRRKAMMDIDSRGAEITKMINTKYQALVDDIPSIYKELAMINHEYTSRLAELKAKTVEKVKDLVDERSINYGIAFDHERILNQNGRSAIVTVLGKATELQELQDQIKVLKANVDFELTNRQRENETLITKSQLDKKANAVYLALQGKTIKSVAHIADSITK